jgi:hypothetical protein
MAQQIKKKFIGPDQIDGSKIKLLQGQSIRGTNSLGEEVDLLQLNSEDKVEVLGQEVALKSDVEQESQERQAADQDLQSQIDDVDGYAQELRSDLDDLDGYAQEIRSDLDEEVIAREQGDAALAQSIEALESDLEDEIEARIAGDEATLEAAKEHADSQDALKLTEAKEYTDTKIADLIGAAPELLDTLEEIAEALQDEQSATGAILTQLADHEQRIEALEMEKEVLEFQEIVSFPVEGESGKIYVAKDSNKLYRYEPGQEGGELILPVAPQAPELVVTTSITDQDDLQATIDAASNGDVIFLANGTYSLAGLSISKEIALVGESQAGVLIQDSRTNSQTFMNVSANNVTLKDLTVRHATTDTAIGIAIAASGSGFPQVRLQNFRMYNVKSQYSKGGLSVRSDNFVVEGCTFEVVAGSSTRRGILHYGNGGDSFIRNNHFINATTGALRAICPTSTSGSNPSDDQAGSLTIEGSSFTGNLSQFVNMDNHQGQPGAFELIVKDNVTPETNAFVVSFGGVDNFGDLFSRIVLIGNTLTNNHALGLGKGALAIDGINGPRPFRSSPLEVVSSSNVLGQLEFRAGYAEAAGSTGAIVGYATAQISEPTVELTSGNGGGAEGQYIELSPTIDQDLSELEDRLEALEEKVDGPFFSNGSAVVEDELAHIDLDKEYVKLMSVSVGRLAVHEGQDYTVSVVEGKTRLTWINSLANPDGEEKIELGDKIFWVGAYLPA